MVYRVTSIIIGETESPKKLKEDALKDIREVAESKGENPNSITLDDIILHRIVVKIIDYTEYEIWESIGNERLHKKKFKTMEDKNLYLKQMLMKVCRDNGVN